MGDEDVSALAAAIGQGCGLTSLSLCDIVSCAGAIALSVVLGSLALTRLELIHTKIRDAGGLSIAAALCVRSDTCPAAGECKLKYLYMGPWLDIDKNAVTTSAAIAAIPIQYASRLAVKELRATCGQCSCELFV